MNPIRIRYLKPLFVFAIGLGFILPSPQPSHAEASSDTRFFCGKTRDPETGKEIPTTLVKTKRGNVAMIRWQSSFFANAAKDFTPLDRCQEVSRRFQTYYKAGVLAYLTTGKMNTQNVICVSDEYGGPCQGLLLTLEPKDDPEKVLQDLLNVRNRARGAITRSTGSSYVDVQEFLDNAPVEQEISSAAPIGATVPQSKVQRIKLGRG